MKRVAPLSFVTGLFMAIALPLRAGEAAGMGQNVESWLTRQQASLTITLDNRLSDAGGKESRPANATLKTPLTPQVIRVSTVPVKRLAAPAI